VTRRFQLSVERAPGALERVLGVARRRRLGLESMSVTTVGSRWDVAIIAGAAPGEAALALRQFTALVNVRQAALEQVEE